MNHLGCFFSGATNTQFSEAEFFLPQARQPLPCASDQGAVENDGEYQGESTKTLITERSNTLFFYLQTIFLTL